MIIYSLIKKHYLKIIGILIILTIVWIFQRSQLKIPPNEQQKPVDQILTNDWFVGNPNQAKIIVIEYSDLECPACLIYRDVPQQILTKYSNEVAMAFRHFPLTQHSSSRLAANLTELAGKQGKFFEMANLLFNSQKEWSNSSKNLSLFIEYGNKLNLNTSTWIKDIDKQEIKSLVEADYLSGLVAKVNSTPTFYINGQKINNLKGPNDLFDRIDLILIEATTSTNRQP